MGSLKSDAIKKVFGAAADRRTPEQHFGRIYDPGENKECVAAAQKAMGLLVELKTGLDSYVSRGERAGLREGTTEEAEALFALWRRATRILNRTGCREYYNLPVEPCYCPEAREALEELHRMLQLAVNKGIGHDWVGLTD